MAPFKLIYAVALLLVIAGCDTASPDAQPISQQNNTLVVELVFLSGHQLQTEYQAAIRKHTSLDGSAQLVDAFNIKRGDTCVIYTETPKRARLDFLIENLGHELLHCYVGQYHPDGKSPKYVTLK